MESDPLQQLRDVHLPPDPAWWPPAFGWWIVLALGLVLLGWMIFKAIHAYRRRAPIRQARTLLSELHTAYAEERINAEDFLHQGNEMLKRLLVRAYGRRQFAAMSGQAWLQALDQLSATDHFSNGPGQVLGDSRFSAQPEVDVDSLNRELQHLLARIQS